MKNQQQAMKTFILTLLLFISTNVFCQETNKHTNQAVNVTPTKEEKNAVKTDTLFRPYYPEGIYFTKEEFMNKQPGEAPKISIRTLRRRYIRKDTTLHSCKFYYTKTGKIIRKVFAVSYKGHLYFQIKAILKNRNKNDRAQSNNFPNGFVRVILGGDHYFYTEVDLANGWAQGFAFGIGGVAGSIAAQSMVKGKGVVWDFKHNEFNIFKSCRDYNRFMEKVYPEGVQKCRRHQPDIFKVRATINIIK